MGKGEGLPTTDGPGQGVLAALARILRPLVRLLIARGVPFPAATEVLRSLYVEVASDEFQVEGKRQTDSRVHLLTGVHRKDVKRLREARDAPPAAPRKVSLTSLLIARWTTLDEYRDERGRPRALPRASSDEASFESLVRSINTDIRPRVVLDEWQRLGIADVDDEDRITLRVEAFVPPKGSDEILHFLGRNARDHLAAAVHNVLGDGDPFLERSTVYDQLGEQSVAELRDLAAERGMDALRTVNQRALALQQRDAGLPAATRAMKRISFGAYFFCEDEPPSDDADAAEDGKP